MPVPCCSHIWASAVCRRPRAHTHKGSRLTQYVLLLTNKPTRQPGCLFCVHWTPACIYIPPLVKDSISLFKKIMAVFYSWRPEIKVRMFLTPYCCAHRFTVYKLLKSNQRTFGHLEWDPVRRCWGQFILLKCLTFWNALDPRSCIPQFSTQTIWDHHSDDHLCQLCGLSRLHPFPRGWLECHQLQPGE